MGIPKAVRDEVLVEARHRCTICAEKCFEIHHIVEQAEGGGHEPENLIVLCPNCHQQRYHRNGEFTRDQLRLYKKKLLERNEVERRLLLNLDDIRARIGTVPLAQSESELRAELSEAATQVSPKRSESVQTAVAETSRWLAERELLKGGARRAIEIHWEVERQQARAAYGLISIVGVDEDSWAKAGDFPAAYYFALTLSDTPHYQWVQIFNNEYHQSLYNMKRRTRVDGRRLIMVVADSDNLQGHVDFAKRLVDQTNRYVTDVLLPRVDAKIEQAKRSDLDEFDTIKSLKEAMKGLKI